MKTFLLNGKSYFINESISLFQLLLYFNYNDSLLVLEYNHLICPRKKWDEIFIQTNDTIEIVTIVGGG